MKRMRKRSCAVEPSVKRETTLGWCSWAILALSLSGIALGTSCVTVPEGIPHIIQGSEQNDLPMPIDFEFDAARSYAYDPPTPSAQGRFRSLCNYYRGQAQVGPLKAWYVEEMRKHNWQFKSADDKDNRLFFEKDNEVSDIEISREIDAKAGSYITIVRARIHPLGPEDLSIEQSLGLMKEAGVKPTSYPVENEKEDPFVEKPEAPGIAPGSVKDLETIPAPEKPSVEGNPEKAAVPGETDEEIREIEEGLK